MLPRELDETSGVAESRAHSGVLWTHNDDGSRLVAIDFQGGLLARWDVRPELRDWEDIEVARCRGSAWCLYLADTGDNEERRRDGNARILRVAEPEVTAGTRAADGRGSGALRADVFPVRFPDGPRDVEALFVLPGEQLYLVSKGRRDPVGVYRYPGALRPDTVTLIEVQRLSGGPESLLSMVTGASASPDGSVVAIRTYQALHFYGVAADTLFRLRDGLVNLRTLEEIQGEGVGLGEEGRVHLTSEGGPLGGPPSMRLLHCRTTARS